jgi:hypothetical protein
MCRPLVHDSPEIELLGTPKVHPGDHGNLFKG